MIAGASSPPARLGPPPGFVSAGTWGQTVFYLAGITVAVKCAWRGIPPGSFGVPQPGFRHEHHRGRPRHSGTLLCHGYKSALRVSLAESIAKSPISNLNAPKPSKMPEHSVFNAKAMRALVTLALVGTFVRAAPAPIPRPPAPAPLTPAAPRPRALVFDEITDDFYVQGPAKKYPTGATPTRHRREYPDEFDFGTVSTPSTASALGLTEPAAIARAYYPVAAPALAGPNADIGLTATGAPFYTVIVPNVGEVQADQATGAKSATFGATVVGEDPAKATGATSATFGATLGEDPAKAAGATSPFYTVTVPAGAMPAAFGATLGEDLAAEATGATSATFGATTDPAKATGATAPAPEFGAPAPAAPAATPSNIIGAPGTVRMFEFGAAPAA